MKKAQSKAILGLKELVETLEDWEETMEVLEDKQLVTDVKISETEAKQKRFTKYEDLLKSD